MPVLTDQQRNELRRLQNKVLFHLQAVPAYKARWDEPIVAGGPTPRQMEGVLYPEHEADFKSLLNELFK